MFKPSFLITILFILIFPFSACEPAPTPVSSAIIPTVTTTVAQSPSEYPSATEPAIIRNTWFKTYGGRQDDVAWGVLPVEDGGYYIVGTTDLEFEPQMRGNVYLIRTDAAGEVLWEHVYERDGYAEGSAISWSSDGNLLISGSATFSTTNGMDIYLLKVDPEGNELWMKTFGGPLDEMGTAWPLDDGGYILVGNIVDPNDLVADPGAPGYGGMAGRSNIYVAQVSANGNALWTQTYGGENNVMVFDGLQMSDGGLLLLATIMYYPMSDDDIYLLRLDVNGNEVWSRTWEEGLASAIGLIPTEGGNYMIVGTYSAPEIMDREKKDPLFIAVDQKGNEIWRNIWGDPDQNDSVTVSASTADGGTIAAGDIGGSLSGWNQDMALLKIDAQGQLLWHQTIKTQTHQMYGQILQLPDGGYILVGSLIRNGRFDIFLIKTNKDGIIDSE